MTNTLMTGMVFFNTVGEEVGKGEEGGEELHLGGQGDLASRTLVLESKRFYLDVKENQRGNDVEREERPDKSTTDKLTS